MKRIKWKDWTVEDFKRYYDDNFAGKSRGEVAKKTKEGKKFYDAVCRRGVIDEVFPPNQRYKFAGLTLDEFIDYREKNFPEKTRDEVRKSHPAFYRAVRRSGYEDQVLLKAKYKSWDDMGKEELREYYVQNLDGCNRSEVQNKEPGFFRAVHRKNLVDEVLPESKTQNWEDWELDDFKKHYEENFEGMSRSAIKRDAENGGTKFYGAVRRRGLVNQVFPKSKRKSRPRGFYDDEENIRKELDTIVDEIGRFPTVNELRERDTGFYAGIRKYYGGITNIKIRLGYVDNELAVLSQILEGVDAK